MALNKLALTNGPDLGQNHQSILPLLKTFIQPVILRNLYVMIKMMGKMSTSRFSRMDYQNVKNILPEIMNAAWTLLW